MSNEQWQERKEQKRKGKAGRGLCGVVMRVKGEGEKQWCQATYSNEERGQGE